MTQKAGKIYAVKNGRKTGLFYSWEECQEQVVGYPEAKYKSFKTEKDALAYLNEDNNEYNNEHNLSADEIAAYVDGSYNESTGEYSAGIVILTSKEKLTFSQKGNNTKLASMRNVAGEIKAAEFAMDYACKNNYRKLTIYHDYEGIEKWCTGEWKAGKEGTQKYKQFYDEVSKKISITFVKVAAHAGNLYNEEADRLAKEAVGLKAPGMPDSPLDISIDENNSNPYISLGVNSNNSDTNPNINSIDIDSNSFLCSNSHTKIQDLNATFYITYKGFDISMREIEERFKKIWVEKGRKIEQVKKLNVYIDMDNHICRCEIKTEIGKETEFIPL